MCSYKTNFTQQWGVDHIKLLSAICIHKFIYSTEANPNKLISIGIYYEIAKHNGEKTKY